MPANYEQCRKSQIIELLKKIVLTALPLQGECRTAVDSFFLVRRNEPHQSQHCLSLPMVMLLINGEKQINLANARYTVKAGQMLVTCVDVPSASLIKAASPDNPFLSVHFLLNKTVLADLLSEMPPENRPDGASSDTAWVTDPPLDFMETILRLAIIAANPSQANILGALVLRELHYLLLAGSHGAIMHELYMRGAKDNRIIDAIMWLKQNIRSTVSIEALAKKVNMSVSSLHRHFKHITGYSPLQYHKKLRLYEAQRLMLAENERADIAAMAVGYESITQFNREYKRLFGEPPHRDITRRKNMASS